MEYALQDAEEGPSNHFQVTQGKITLIELSIRKAVADSLPNKPVHLLVSGRLVCTYTGFARVCQHHYGRLFAAGLGARISEVGFIYAVTVRRVLDRRSIEVRDQVDRISWPVPAHLSRG